MIAATERSHFWHVPRRRLLRALIGAALGAEPGPVLDVGCGTGSLVTELRGDGIDAYGVDPYATERDLPPATFAAGTVDALPYPHARFGLVGLFDVLEHVEEAPALSEAARVLQPGGVLIVSVPAFAWLWGPRDELAGHLRRYSRRSLIDCLHEAGFHVERVIGYQALLLPLLLLQRWRARGAAAEAISPEDHPPRWLNAVLRGLNQMEVSLPSRLRPPLGSSLIAIARKPQ